MECLNTLAEGETEWRETLQGAPKNIRGGGIPFPNPDSLPYRVGRANGSMSRAAYVGKKKF